MKVKTSITLSEELLKAISKRSKDYESRSDFIETALWAFIHRSLQAERDRRDLEILNRESDRLNREAEDVLDYQVSL